MKLEERLVLDGAALHHIFDKVTEQNDSFAIDHLNFDNSIALASSDRAPAPAVLVISSAIPNHEQLEMAVDEHAIVVSYDANSASLEQILEQIVQELGDQKASSIAFANHGTEQGEFQLTATEQVSLDSLLRNGQMEQFWQKIGQLVQADGRIDLLACEIGKAPDAMKFASQLEWLTKRSIAFSDEKIGSPDLGGTWILDEVFEKGEFYKTELDVSKIYFNTKLLNDWSGILALPVDLGVTDRSNDNSLTDEPLLVILDDPQDLYSSNAANTNFGKAISIGSTKMIGGGNGIVELFDYTSNGWCRTGSFTSASSTFGNHVAMWQEQGLAIVGDDGSSSSAGTITCYTYDSINIAWSVTTLAGTLPTLATGDCFGISLAANGDYLVVGASGDTSNKGAIYIYSKSAATWTKVTPTAGTPGANNYFGCSVAIENTRIIVGAYNNGTGGAVYIYDYNGSSWIETQQIIASDAAVSGNFGYSVALSGDRIAIGAYGQNSKGAVYIFEKGIGSSPWAQTTKLTPLELSNNDQFGYSVALKGNALIASSNNKTVVSMTGGNVTAAGQVYLFEKKSAGWAEIKAISKPNLTSVSDDSIYLGESVALNERYAVIGIKGEDTSGAEAGKLLIYEIKDSGAALDHFINSKAGASQVSLFTNGTSGSSFLLGAYDLKVVGNYTYVISTNLISATVDAGLTILDTSDPYNPVFKGQLAIGKALSDLEVYGNYLYISSRIGNYLKIIDVSDPTNPIQVGSFTINLAGLYYPASMCIQGNKLYISSSGNKICIYDLSTPTSPTLLTSLVDGTNLALTTPYEKPYGMCVQGNYLYYLSYPTGTTYQITVVDISTTPPTIAGTESISQFYAIAVRGNYLFVHRGSLAIYNISDPSNITSVSTVSGFAITSSGSNACGIVVEGNYVYLSGGGDSKVAVIDISDISQPYLVKTIESSNGPGGGTFGEYIPGLDAPIGIAVKGNFLYAADRDGNDLSIIQLDLPDSKPVTRSFTYDGSSQYLTLPAINLGTTAITLEAWVYVKALPVAPSHSHIFDLGNGAPSYNIILRINSISSRVELIVYNGASGITARTYTGTATITMNEWNHLAVTLNGTAGVIYINGAVDKSGTFTSGTISNVNRTSNYIAKSNLATGTYFQGHLIEARIWNIARTRGQILANMRVPLQGNETGLVAYYPCNDLLQEVVYDMSHHMRHAILGQSASTTTGNPTSTIITLPASRCSLEGYATIDTPFALGSAFTEEAWVYIPYGASSDTNTYGVLGNSTSSNYAPSIQVKTLTVIVTMKNTAASTASITTNKVLREMEWNHIAFTYDGTNALVYVNGVKLTPGTTSGTFTGTSSYTVTYINATKVSPFSDRFFSAQLAEVRIWNTARTQSQIYSNKAKRLQGNETGLQAYYIFEESATDTNIYDVTGVGSDATCSAVPDRPFINRTLSNFDRGLFFDGVNDYISIPTFTLGSTAITLEGWINVYDPYTGTYPIGTIFTLFDLGNGLNNNNICLRFQYDNSNRYVQLLSYNGATGSTLTSSSTIASTKWIHIAATIDSSGNACIYLNGYLDQTGTINAPNNVSRSINYIAKSSLNAYQYRGTFSSFRVWNVALAADQIHKAMTFATLKYAKGLLINYKMNEESGQYVYDHSGNGYHATLGADNLVNTSDPQYVLSSQSSHLHYALNLNKNVILTINAYDPDNTTPDVVIKTIPSQGFLYQYDSTQANFRGAQITSANTIVSDSQHRVVYYPNMTGASKYAAASFNYTVKDATNETQPASCYINLEPPQSISGTVAGQNVNDTATILPFATLSLAKIDLTKTWTYTITSDAPTHGVLSGSLGVYNSVTGVYTLSDVSPSVAEADIRSIVFTPRNNAIVSNTTETTGFTINCTDGTPNDSTTTVITTSINDAPVLTPATPTIAGIVASDTTNSGQDVATIVGTSITDADFGAVEGIAITLAPISGAGTWQYSINAGTSWSNFPAVNATSALLLRSIDKVRFLPDGSTASTGSITYRAWDQTNGTGLQGTTADPSTNGGTTAFSTTTDTASITVTAGANNAPVLAAATPTLSTITEDNITSSGDTVATIVGTSITDVDAGAVEGIAITAITPGTGTWQYSLDNGTTWTAMGTINAANSLLLLDTNKIRFIPDQNNGSVPSFTFRAWDRTSSSAGTKVDTTTNGGTTAFSTTQNTATITVTDVNDAPVLTSATPTMTTIAASNISNSGQTVAAIVGASITDVDTGAVQGIAITAAPVSTGTGTWQYSTNAGSSWTAFPAVLPTNALLLRSIDKIRFLPDGTTASTGSITYRAWDQTSGTAGSTADPSTNGGTTAFSTATDTASISVTSAVNHAPVILTPIYPTMPTILASNTSNSGLDVATLVGISISDVDVGAVKGIAIIADPVSSGVGTWQYSTNGGTTWTAIGSVSVTNALLLRSSDKVRFLPDGSYAAAGNFSYRAWDQTSGTYGNKVDVSVSGGTTAFSDNVDKASITVTGVVNSPCDLNTTAGATSYILADPVTIIDTGATLTDPDPTVDGAKLTIQITSGSHAKDTLSVRAVGTGAGQINIIGNYIRYGSTVIASYTGASTGAGSITITFKTTATPTAITTLLQNISFYNSDKLATVGVRTITYTYNDNSGFSDSATKSVNVVASASTPSLVPTTVPLSPSPVTSIYNTLAAANQYAPAFSQISSYLRSFFFFR
ncbi:MAG: Ig family protein [Chlamydiales bacterium]|nr:Ig family protein [Chlamydiales bacterium]